jgi:hypothetical protein
LSVILEQSDINLLYFSYSESAALIISETAGEMVIDQARRLHESVADCRPNKLEAAFFKVFTHGI